jgi:hypothetical protein
MFTRDPSAAMTARFFFVCPSSYFPAPAVSSHFHSPQSTARHMSRTFVTFCINCVKTVEDAMRSEKADGEFQSIKELKFRMKSTLNTWPRVDGETDGCVGAVLSSTGSHFQKLSILLSVCDQQIAFRNTRSSQQPARALSNVCCL